MGFQLSKASFFLSPYIKQYWALDNTHHPAEVYRQRIIPSGLIEMTFYFTDLPRSVDCAKNIGSHSILSGQLNGFYDLEISGSLSMFSISFQPLGAFLFFDIPMNELTNQNIPLEFLIKDKSIEIEHSLFEAKSFAHKIQVIERYLYQMLCKREKLYDAKRISQALQTANYSKGLESVSTLAESACFGRKQLERKFSAYVGLSPKQFLKIVQFQSTLYGKQINPSISLSNLTFQAGYFDQAHMIHQFKKLTGLTPKSYFEECAPISDYFS